MISTLQVCSFLHCIDTHYWDLNVVDNDIFGYVKAIYEVLVFLTFATVHSLPVLTATFLLPETPEHLSLNCARTANIPTIEIVLVEMSAVKNDCFKDMKTQSGALRFKWLW